MKKTTILILSFIFIFLASSCSKKSSYENLTTESMNETSDTSQQQLEKEFKEYQKEVSIFKDIDPQTFLEKDFNKPVFVYVGRVSCYYCREFVPELIQVSKNNKVDIYYFDTENISEDIQEKILATYNNIESVPAVLYIKEDNSFDKFDNDTEKEFNEWFEEKLIR